VEHFPDIICAALALGFLAELLLALLMNEEVAVRPRWSGLGASGAGGWSLTRPAVFLLLALVFSFSALAVHMSHSTQPTRPAVEIPVKAKK
jgi:hypothetical protein